MCRKEEEDEKTRRRYKGDDILPRKVKASTGEKKKKENRVGRGMTAKIYQRKKSKTSYSTGAQERIVLRLRGVWKRAHVGWKNPS